MHFNKRKNRFEVLMVSILEVKNEEFLKDIFLLFNNIFEQSSNNVIRSQIQKEFLEINSDKAAEFILNQLSKEENMDYSSLLQEILKFIDNLQEKIVIQEKEVKKEENEVTKIDDVFWNEFVLTKDGQVWKFLKTETDQIYFANKTTKKSQWEIPEDYIHFVKKSKSSKKNLKEILLWEDFLKTESGSHWRKLVTEEGRVYYGNKTMKKTQWDEPLEFIEFVENKKNEMKSKRETNDDWSNIENPLYDEISTLEFHHKEVLNIFKEIYEVNSKFKF
jgi:predicted transcriptional regulator